MFRKILLSLLVSSLSCSLYGALSDSSLKDVKEERFKGPAIRIHLASNADGALVEVKGPYNVYDPKTGKQIESAFASSSYYMYPTRDGLKWGAEFPGIYQLAIVPDKRDTTLLISGTEYRGIGYLYQIDGAIGAVNETSLDDFINSILSVYLPAEVTHREAIAAVAIGLRTEVMRILQVSKNAFWDIKAATFGYRGSSVERQDTAFVDAIKFTRGMILLVGGSPANVSWFTTGGVKAPYDEMERLAQSGKDARAILEKLFPHSVISKA